MATYTKRPTKDVALTSQDPTTNLNTAGILLGRSSGHLRRSILHFDLSDFPSYTAITNATLTINCISASGFINYAGSVHRLTQAGWSETQATWNEYSTGNAWAAADPPYQDYDASVAATFTNPISNGIVVTTDMSALVIDALTSRSSQLHMLLKLTNEAFDIANWTYTDREYEDVFGGIYPQLEVTYTPTPVVGGGQPTIFVPGGVAIV